MGYGLGHALVGRRLAAALAPELVLAAGLVGLSWGLALLSFGLSIGPGVQIGVSALAGLYAGWRWWQAPATARAQWVGRLLAPLCGPGRLVLAALLLVFGALVLVHAGQPPIFPDSALYHAQTVQWAQRYPVVPGLGNLHGRLAFNSHLHLLTAFFSASPQPQHPAWQQALGSFWFLLLVSYCARQVAQTWARPVGQSGGQTAAASAMPPTLTIYYLGSVVLIFVGYRPWISSPMPDSGVALLTLLLLGWVLEKLTAAGPAGRFTRAEMGLLAGLLAAAITYKVSAGCLVLPLGYAAWQRRPTDEPNAGHWLGRAALIGALVLVPWLGRNVVLSGYLVYPLAPWVQLPVDWRVPAGQLAFDLREIRDFARWPGSGWEAVATMRPGAWLPYWWSQQYPGDRRLLLFVLGVAGSVGLARWWRRPEADERRLHGLFFLLLGCCAAWFGAAPAFRFGYAYLIGSALVGSWLLLRKLPGKPVRMLCLIISLAYGLNGLRHEIPNSKLITWWWPASYPLLPTTVVLVQGRPVRVAGAGTNGRCGNCPVPCAADPPPADLYWRGAGLAQGFRRGAGIATAQQ